jgi:hypothetical protein
MAPKYLYAAFRHILPSTPLERPPAMPINQPSNQIKYASSVSRWPFCAQTISCRLTNVSTVRLKKGGKRFEVNHNSSPLDMGTNLTVHPNSQIACYKNKVQEWRNGVYALVPSPAIDPFQCHELKLFAQRDESGRRAPDQQRLHERVQR